jgi:outer membrane protein assembly factor BamD (BamD/ComL family)
LRALDDFDRRFGRSPMAEEAALLRLEATAARGDSSGAAALAQRFLAAHPHSVHAARVRSIVGAGAD